MYFIVIVIIYTHKSFSDIYREFIEINKHKNKLKYIYNSWWQSILLLTMDISN